MTVVIGCLSLFSTPAIDLSIPNECQLQNMVFVKLSLHKAFRGLELKLMKKFAQSRDDTSNTTTST